MLMTLNGGRSRMISARSCAGSILTRKPSSGERRGSANVIGMLLQQFHACFVLCHQHNDRDSSVGDTTLARVVALVLVFAREELAAQQLSHRRFRKFLDEHIT